LLAQAVLGGVPSPLAMKAPPEILLFPIVVSLIISRIPLWTSAAFTGFTAITTPLPPIFAKSRASGASPFSLLIAASFTTSFISNDPNFRLKHPGVPEGSDGIVGTSYTLTENCTLPVAQATGRVAYVPPLLCGDVYTSSERHVCYTLRRGCSYAEAVYPTPGDRRQAWEHLGAPATCLGAPRITVMYSVCIHIYVSMYLCIYIATHLHTLYLDWLRSAEYILPFTLSTSITPLIERV